nr:MAG TPA_asm: hypothetical protein [Caudoviricetes sp.]
MSVFLNRRRPATSVYYSGRRHGRCRLPPVEIA